MKMQTGAFVLGLMLAGCGGGMDQDTTAEAEGNAVADSMSEPMEKAEAVEDQAMEHKEDIDDAIQDAEETVDDAADDMADDGGQ